jgi:hypothetical protein
MLVIGVKNACNWSLLERMGSLGCPKLGFGLGRLKLGLGGLAIIF